MWGNPGNVIKQLGSVKGRKPMFSSILTAPLKKEEVKLQADKRDAMKRKADEKAKKEPPVKKGATFKKPSPAKKGAALKPRTKIGRGGPKIRPGKKVSSPKKKLGKPNKATAEDGDQDFCLICLQYFTKRGPKTIECNVCEREFHLKCVTLNAGGYTCENCDQSD